MITTIQDYLNQTPSKPFLGSAKKPTGIVSEEFQNALVGYIWNNYYDYHFLVNISAAGKELTPELFASLIRLRCDRVYYANAYTYEKLYNTLELEYNPISNYDMEEHEKIINSGVDATESNYGSHTDTVSVGGHTDSYVQGENTLTDIMGNREKSGNNTADKAPFNSQSYQHLDKGAYTETQQSVTDSHKQSSRSDSATIGSRTDKTVVGEHSDSDTVTYGHEIERELSRNGNIGTMTAMDMIRQEREIGMFNLVALVANDIISALCVKYKGVNY